MARFKVTPFVDYKASRYGVRIAGKEFEFLPTCAVISTRPANSSCELAGYVTYSLAKVICNSLCCDAIRVEVTDRNPQTAEFRLRKEGGDSDGHVAGRACQMAKAAVSWLEEHGKEVEFTAPVITA